MKKTAIVTLISLGMLVGFAALVYYGFKHSRGEPVAYQEPEVAILEIAHLDTDIDLSRGVAQDVWASLPAKEIELMYQVTVLPWPTTMVESLSIKSFHNSKEIFFYLSWSDNTENRIHEIGKFSDACAIMFPLEKTVKPTTIMMGFMETTNIWQWKAQQDEEFWAKTAPTTKVYVDFYYPFENEEIFPISKDIPVSAVNDLLAVRVGTVTQKETQKIQGRGFWENGIWHVVFKRDMPAQNPQADAEFVSNDSKYCAFGAWDGQNGDRGGRKSISEWVKLEIEKNE
jgi:DMSO reductase family type II enzyme heme b subunit